MASLTAHRKAARERTCQKPRRLRLRALNGVKKSLLEAHMNSCVVEQIRKGKNDVVDEIMTMIGKLIR
ncbi:MAG: metal-sensing transcriptional repressor [Planctomycetota bacterium]